MLILQATPDINFFGELAKMGVIGLLAGFFGWLWYTTDAKLKSYLTEERVAFIRTIENATRVIEANTEAFKENTEAINSLKEEVRFLQGTQAQKP